MCCYAGPEDYYYGGYPGHPGLQHSGPNGQPPLPPEEPPRDQDAQPEQAQKPKPAEVEAMAPPEVTPEQAEHYKVSNAHIIESSGILFSLGMCCNAEVLFAHFSDQNLTIKSEGALEILVVSKKKQKKTNKNKKAPNFRSKVDCLGNRAFNHLSRQFILQTITQCHGSCGCGLLKSVELACPTLPPQITTPTRVFASVAV